MVPPLSQRWMQLQWSYHYQRRILVTARFLTIIVWQLERHMGLYMTQQEREETEGYAGKESVNQPAGQSVSQSVRLKLKILNHSKLLSTSHTWAQWISCPSINTVGSCCSLHLENNELILLWKPFLLKKTALNQTL